MSDFRENQHPRSRSGRFAPKHLADNSEMLLVGGQDFADLLESAAHLQRLVPGTVLVGGTAAALHAGHRTSVDHDHVLGGLRERYEAVVKALESDTSWRTEDDATKPPSTVMGTLDGHQAGVRHQRRELPLETQEIILPSGSVLEVPTEPEMLRIKAFLLTSRNSVRDYLDTAALADHLGLPQAGRVLARIDDYYSPDGDVVSHHPIASNLARRLASPSPKDHRSIQSLGRYKNTVERWRSWQAITETCRAAAVEMTRALAQQEKP